MSNYLAYTKITKGIDAGKEGMAGWLDDQKIEYYVWSKLEEER